MFKKVHSFSTEHQLSRNHSMSVCVDGAYSAMTRIKKALCKTKTEHLGSYCHLCQEKIRKWRNLRRPDISFKIYFIC